MNLLKKCGPQIRLCLFTFRPTASRSRKILQHTFQEQQIKAKIIKQGLCIFLFYLVNACLSVIKIL